MIESNANAKIKTAAALKEKKYRDEAGLFLTEGLRLVCDICNLYSGSVQSVFLTERSLSAFLERVPDEKIKQRIDLVSETVIKKLSDTTVPQEVVAVVKKPHNGISGDRVIFLDRLRDPGNLGTVIRTAAAAGYSLILNECADAFSPKVVRSCMGGIMSVGMTEGGIEQLSALKDSGFTLYAADMGGGDLFKTEKARRVCAVIGGEAEGITPEVKALCHKTVSIPMEKGVESLNAAVSAAIVMYYFRNTV